MSTGADKPMKPDHRGIFDDDTAHVKVVLSLKRKNYHVKDIARATGLTEAAVRKVLDKAGVHHE